MPHRRGSTRSRSCTRPSRRARPVSGSCRLRADSRAGFAATEASRRRRRGQQLAQERLDLREIRGLLDREEPPTRAVARADEERRRHVGRELVVEPLELDHRLVRRRAFSATSHVSSTGLGERLDGDQRRVGVEDGDPAPGRTPAGTHRLEEPRPAVDPAGAPPVSPLLRRRPRPSAAFRRGRACRRWPGRPGRRDCRRSRRSTERTPRRTSASSVPERADRREAGRRDPGRRATASRRHRGTASRRAGGAAPPVWQNRSGSPSPRSATCARNDVVRREARHQRHRGSRDRAPPPGAASPELDLEEAPSVDRLRHGLDAATEPRRHATGEDDDRDRARAKRLRPRRDAPPRSPALPGAGSDGEVAGLRRLDDALDDVRPGRERPGAEGGPEPIERGGVEPVPLEHRACPRIDLVEDHRDRTGTGSEAAYGARCTPSSVTIAAIRSAGVTSKAGLRAAKRGRHLGAVPLLDRNRRAVGACRDRSSRSERRSRTGSRGAARAPRGRRCRSCSRVSPFAAMRSAPVITMSTSPARHPRRRRPVDDHRVAGSRGPPARTPSGGPPGAAAGSRRPRPARRLPRSQAARIAPTADPYPPVARPPALQWVRIRAPGGTSSAACAPMRRQRVYLVVVNPLGPLPRRVGSHLVESPAEIDRSRSRGRQRLVGGVDVVAAGGGERQAVRGGDADRGGAPHRKRPDRVGELGRVAAAELDHLVGEPPLVEHDDRVVLEPDDALRLEIARRGARHVRRRARGGRSDRRSGRRRRGAVSRPPGSSCPRSR